MPKITKQLVENTMAPEKGDTYVWDTELPGFGFRVQPSGRKTYIVRYRTRDAKRQARKMTLCRCVDAVPDKARTMARDVFQSVAAGNDPAAERKPEMRDADVSLEALFKARVTAMRAKGRAMADEVERVLLLAKNNAADFLGRTTPPADVTPKDIVNYVSTFYKAGHPGAADKARSYLAATFEWAIKSANDYTVAVRQDWGLTINPAAAVAKDHSASKARDRNLSATEMRIFWNACSDGNAGFSEGTEVCLKLIMACGQRVMETLRIDGRDIDLTEKVWTMPAHKTKGKKHPHDVPLPDIIIADLRRLKDKHGDGPLFPAVHDSSASGVLGPLAIAHAVRRWCTSEDCPIPAFQPRDLRRTWKSRAGDGAGIDRFTRDLIQQHTMGGSGTKHYDRAEYLPQKREAMKKWDRWMRAMLTGEAPEQKVA